MPNTPSAPNERSALAVVLVLIAGLWTAAALHARREAPAAPLARDGPLYRVPINTADAPTLQLLPHVGPRRADAVIAARRTAPFAGVGDLQRVHGIGDVVARRIAPHVRFDGPRPGTQPADTQPLQ